MGTTSISLKEIRVEIDASITQLADLDPSLAKKIQESVLRAFAENERIKADKLYQEMKKSYY